MPSGVIRAMRFDPMKSVLEIVFRGARGAYRYFDVPVEEWRKFREATSKGEYLNSFFKAREYPFEKLSGPVAVPSRMQKNHQRSLGASEPMQWGEPLTFPSDRKPSAIDPAIRLRARVSVQEEMFFEFEDAA